MPLRLLHKKTHTFAFILLGITLVAVGIVWYNQQPSRAADLSKFDPGNIMSDAVMSNKNSMTEAQIQAFLDSKNPCNNTNTYMASWYPHLQYNIRDGKFVCMAKERFNGESAAHIIWQAGQDYNINPQVLIVLLQKEQGLITDTWPNHIQYRGATGYGCPDTAPCDEQYYGLKNQIRKSASLFRTVLDGGWSNYPVGNNYVQYNPNTACGGSVINIKNRATSALYRYTPYQPNQSALNAGYGTGDSCGAYGNRNFWAYFTDWFGSTINIFWGKMDDPRWMQPVQETQKIDLSNLEPVDAVIPESTQIKFVNKTTINGTVYLQSEYDALNGHQKGIPLPSLNEIPFIEIDSPRWMTITCNEVRKITPNNGKSTGVLYKKGLVAEFTSKTLVNNRWYLRTKTDTANNNNLGFPIHCVDTSYTTETISFDKPRNLYVPSNSAFTDLNHPKNTYYLKANQVLYFSRKFLFNGLWYYQTDQDYLNNRLIGVRSTDTFEAVDFTPMDDPRALTLKHSSQKWDLVSTRPVGETLPRGMVRHYVDKYQSNGVWYLRTQYDYENNIQLGIPLQSLQ